MHFIEIAQLLKRVLVSKRYVDHAVVCKRRHRRERRALLSTTQSGRGNEETGIFTGVRALRPLGTGGIPERPPLAGEVTEASGNPEKKAVVRLERLGVDDRDIGLWQGVDAFQKVVGECLFDSVRNSGSVR